MDQQRHNETSLYGYLIAIRQHDQPRDGPVANPIATQSSATINGNTFVMAESQAGITGIFEASK